MDVIYAVGKNLREIRHKRKYSVRMLADFSGISKNQILKIEHGNTDPKISTLVRLAKALQVGLFDLLSEKGDIKEWAQITMIRAGDAQLKEIYKVRSCAQRDT